MELLRQNKNGGIMTSQRRIGGMQLKVAIIGSRNLQVYNFGKYLPNNVSEIISGGARGIDTCASKYAKEKGIKLTEFLPEYEKFGRAAPLKRNLQIIDYADLILAFWDGKSNGTKFVIDNSKKQNKPIKIFVKKI